MSIKPGTDYTVKSGDTLSGIALQAYGDGSEASWRRIYNANRSEIGGDPDRITSGQVLYIPECDIMPGIDYTVRSGDTLSAIALRAYGDGSEASWRKIYDANRSEIGDDPDRITPGQVLCIPI
jgi:nucleoid-associated protein YgaU